MRSAARQVETSTERVYPVTVIRVRRDCPSRMRVLWDKRPKTGLEGGSRQKDDTVMVLAQLDRAVPPIIGNEYRVRMRLILC